MPHTISPTIARTASHGIRKPIAITMPLSVATRPFQPAASPSPNPAGFASTVSTGSVSVTVRVDIATCSS